MEELAGKRVRIGVVGLGLAGGIMVPAITAHSGFILAGAAEPNAELRARFARDHSCPIDATASALLARDDIDAVYIATPHQLHREHAVLAAERGKHVIVEKPMALTLADCDAMIDAFDKSRTALVVGHTHSFNPAIKVMRDTIASGAVGRLSMIAMLHYTDFMYRPRRPEELDTSLGGGIVFNQIPHQVDIARLLANARVVRVRATTDILDTRRPTEGSCMAMLTFDSGAAASLVYSGYDRFDSDEFQGWVGEGGRPKRAAHGATARALGDIGDSSAETKARAQRYGYGARSWVPDAGERWHQPHFGTLVVSCEQADMRPSLDGVSVYDHTGQHEIAVPASMGRPGRAEVLDELYAAIVTGARPVHDGAFARATLQVCLAMQESSRAGKEVVLQ
jgi:phthalate 4,5-cis-dihydrodiol dehydrogenase